MKTYTHTIIPETFPTSSKRLVPNSTTKFEKYRTYLTQQIEHAGRSLAILAKEHFLQHHLSGQQVAVLAGVSSNGGSALVCARRLHSLGVDVQVFMTDTDERMAAVTLRQKQLLKQIGVPVHLGTELPGDLEYDLIIDGIMESSATQKLCGLSMEMIHWINAGNEKVIAIDLPSGLNSRSNRGAAAIVEADATLTLAMPKESMFTERAKHYIGSLYLGDMRVPSTDTATDIIKIY